MFKFDTQAVNNNIKANSDIIEVSPEMETILAGGGALIDALKLVELNGEKDTFSFVVLENELTIKIGDDSLTIPAPEKGAWVNTFIADCVNAKREAEANFSTLELQEKWGGDNFKNRPSVGATGEVVLGTIAYRMSTAGDVVTVVINRGDGSASVGGVGGGSFTDLIDSSAHNGPDISVPARSTTSAITLIGGIPYRNFT